MTDKEKLACLTDRPCSVCKHKKENGCCKWSCVFDEPSESDNKGEWIKSHEVEDVAENSWYTVYRCSKCGGLVESWKQSNFCPNCGADMRGGAHEGRGLNA